MKINKEHCLGCSDNFYNGNNQLNVKECWAFKTAKKDCSCINVKECWAFKTAKKDCSCKDWKENIPWSFIHGQGGYKGKQFNYCPWCGKELTHE